LIGALPFVALAAGATRVVKGVRVPHPCGDPRLTEEADLRLSERIVAAGLRALGTEVSGTTVFEPEMSGVEGGLL
jgi:glycine reductase